MIPLLPTELASYYEAMGQITPFEAIEVFVPVIPLSSMEDVSGVKEWTAPVVIHGQVLDYSSRRPSNEFGDPDQSSLQVLVKPVDLSRMASGMVYRLLDYSVWWGEKPEIENSGLPHQVIRLVQVPPTAVPSLLREGAPALPEISGTLSTRSGYMKRIPATFPIDSETGLRQRAIATVTNPIPTSVTPIAISNRAAIEPGSIVVAEDRLSLYWDLDESFGEWDPDTMFLTFMVEGI